MQKHACLQYCGLFPYQAFWFSSLCLTLPTHTSLLPLFFKDTKRDRCQQDDKLETLGPHPSMQTWNKQQTDWNSFVGDLKSTQGFAAIKKNPYSNGRKLHSVFTQPCFTLPWYGTAWMGKSHAILSSSAPLSIVCNALACWRASKKTSFWLAFLRVQAEMKP